MTPPDPVTALGYVDPPPPDVLETAREALWSAVAHEMLTTDPASTQTVPPAGRSVPQTVPPAGRTVPQTRRLPSPEPGCGRQSSGRPDE